MDKSARDRLDRYEIGIAVVLCLLIIGSAVMIGSVAPLGRSIVVCSSLLLLVLWLLRGLRNHRIEVLRSWAWLPIAAWFALLGLQMTPLPIPWIERLSPGTLADYRAMLGASLPERLTLSLYPYGTLCEFMRIGALFLVFFVTLHFVRSRRHAVILIVAILAIALFESLYGMAQRFAGDALSTIKTFDAESSVAVALAGTFWSKNNMAALLSMATLSGAGLLMAAFGPQKQDQRVRSELIESFSSSAAGVSMLLTICILVTGVSLFLTLSRGALFATFVAAVVFAVCAAAGLQSRRYLVHMVVLVVATVIALAIIGSEVVAARMQDVVTGRAASWVDRLNMLVSGWDMFKDHPLFGMGVGAFRFTFERYQSVRFGDYVVDYLHNDWAQILCDAGLVGMAIILAAVAFLVATTFRAALRQRDYANRWIALGSLTAVIALLLHSLVDFNLSKVTSNGIVFGVLLAISYAMARMRAGGGDEDRPRHWRISIGPTSVRWAIGTAAVALAALLCVMPVRMGVADVLLNKVAGGIPRMPHDDYFFLPLEADLTDDESAACMSRAIELDPQNAQMWFSMSMYRTGVIENIVIARAKEKAREHLAGLADTSPERVDALAPALSASLVPGVVAERLQDIRDAVTAAQKAASLLPPAAKYHLRIADVSAQLLDVLPPGDATLAYGQLARHEAALARFLAPRKPLLLFRVGRVYLRCADHETDEAAKRSLQADALASLRRSLIGNPYYTGIVYPLLQAYDISAESPLIAVTPRTSTAYQRLVRVLWDRGMWNDLLSSLDTLESIYKEEVVAEDVSPWTLRKERTAEEPDAPVIEEDYVDADRYLMKDEVTYWQSLLLQRRAAVLAVQGRWNEWREAAARYRAFQKKAFEDHFNEGLDAGRLREFDRAMDALRAVARANWGEPEYLLAMADICLAMRRPSVEPYWEGPINLLYRIIINNDQLTRETVAKMRDMLDRIAPQSPDDRIVASFTEGAAAILSGDVAQGVRSLESMTQSDDKAVNVWRQRHLVWYYLGLGYDRLNSPAQALAAYRRVVELVPAHEAALRRIAALDAGNCWRVEDALRDLTPETRCDINIGGKMILRGYTVSQDCRSQRESSSQTTTGDWYLTCFWEVRDRMSSRSALRVDMLTDTGDPVITLEQRFRNEGKLYPVDFPRCGEILVDRMRLDDDPRKAGYLRMVLRAPDQGGRVRSLLLNPAGDAMTTLSLWKRP